jgi:hypothetical protein
VLARISDGFASDRDITLGAGEGQIIARRMRQHDQRSGHPACGFIRAKLLDRGNNLLAELSAIQNEYFFMIQFCCSNTDADRPWLDQALKISRFHIFDDLHAGKAVNWPISRLASLATYPIRHATQRHLI